MYFCPGVRHSAPSPPNQCRIPWFDELWIIPELHAWPGFDQPIWVCTFWPQRYPILLSLRDSVQKKAWNTCLKAHVISDMVHSLHCAGYVAQLQSYLDAYTASLARPLARRARMTARPPRVFMRTKKPWVRFLLVTEGWYVRFILNYPWEVIKRGITIR